MDKTIHILLVEDLPVIQRAVAHVMHKLGAEMTIAACGADALEHFKNNTYDLIFMDIGLPDITGDIVTQQMRAFEKDNGTHTPIIALTANRSQDDHPSYIDSGMEEVMLKPISVPKARVIFDKYISG